MFRNAEEKDFALYMELAGEFYHSPAVMHPIPEQYMENTFREAMRSDDYIILRILEVDGAAAGYAILSRSFSPESGSPICWIEELYIREAFRGRGIGTEFFAAVRQEFPGVRLRLEGADDGADGAGELLVFGFLHEKPSFPVERGSGRRTFPECP